MEDKTPVVGGNPAAVPGGSRGTSQSGVRLYNERLILSLIRRHPGLAKVEIARLTGLSAQTTTVIINRLEADGLLVGGEPQRGRIGQPSVPYTLNPDGAFGLGLMIGRRSSDLVLMDFTAGIRARHRCPTRPPALQGHTVTSVFAPPATRAFCLAHRGQDTTQPYASRTSSVPNAPYLPELLKNSTAFNPGDCHLPQSPRLNAVVRNR